MSERNPVTSDDLRTAAKFVVGAVRKLDPELFGKRAYGLEWTRSETITHIAAGFFFTTQTLSAERIRRSSVREGLAWLMGVLLLLRGKLN